MSEVAERIAALGDQMAEFRDHFAVRLSELEKRAAREREPGDVIVESIGQKLVVTDAFRALNGGRARGRASVDFATTMTTGTGTVGSGTSASTSLVAADRVPGIITPAERVMTVRDLIAPGITGSGNIEYVKETGYTNNADVVTEGTTKPYSNLTFDLKTAPVRTIAHLFKASKQLLDDADGLASYINVRALYGLKEKEELQLLRGDGTGQNISGLVPQASEFNTALRKAGDTKIDVLRRAILQVRKAEYRASGIVLSPDDVADIETTKDDNGRYIYINVVEGGQNRIWKLPIVETTAMDPGEFLVGAFNIAAQVFDRQQATVEVSTENADDFEKNLCSIRCEERIAMAVYRPESFVYGDFSDAVTGT